jgi:hypothetical protein
VLIRNMCVSCNQEIHVAVRRRVYEVNHTNGLPLHACIDLARSAENTVTTATANVRLSLSHTIADRVHEL